MGLHVNSELRTAPHGLLRRIGTQPEFDSDSISRG